MGFQYGVFVLFCFFSMGTVKAEPVLFIDNTKINKTNKYKCIADYLHFPRMRPSKG